MAKAKYYMKVKESVIQLPATLYGLYVHKTGNHLTIKDIYSIENTLNRYRKKYPFVSFLMVVSNTDSKFCSKRDCIEIGKRGRPITKIIGKQVPLHVHIAVIGDKNHSAYKYVKEVKKALEKHFKSNSCSYWTKGSEKHAINYINYILKQSFRPRKCGIFNDILECKSKIKIRYL